MKNKDGQLILNSLINNGITLSISDCKITEEIKKFETLKHEHLGPDLIGISEEEIYGIEHFYVDASKKNRKGNTLKSEYGGRFHDYNSSFRKFALQTLVIPQQSWFFRNYPLKKTI